MSVLWVPRLVGYSGRITCEILPFRLKLCNNSWQPTVVRVDTKNAELADNDRRIWPERLRKYKPV